MKIPAPALLRFAIAVSLIGASIASHAAMYKWIDEDGSVTYSNTPPVDRSKVKEFTKVEDISTVPADKRSREAQAGSDKRSADHANAKSDVAAPSSAPRPMILVSPDAGSRPDSSTKSSAHARSEGVKREAEVVRLDVAPRAATPPPALQTEAVQDPCLTSADPHCYQRNRDKYHPYLGYAPSARAAGAAAVGASTSPAATGAVGGQFGIATGPDKRAAPSTVPAPPIRVQTK